jgi:hypothetical protein
VTEVWIVQLDHHHHKTVDPPTHPQVQVQVRSGQVTGKRSPGWLWGPGVAGLDHKVTGQVPKVGMVEPAYS